MLEYLSQINPAWQPVEGVESHRPEREDERPARPLAPLMRQIVEMVAGLGWHLERGIPDEECCVVVPQHRIELRSMRRELACASLELRKQDLQQRNRGSRTGVGRDCLHLPDRLLAD